MMDRQAILNNFVTATKGWGRAFYNQECCYFPIADMKGNQHPGCGIGSQPGFREKFKAVVCEGRGIRAICQAHPEVAEFFGVEIEEDEDFLRGVQTLHDDEDHWDDKNLKLEPLQIFCDKWSLNLP